ncbi:hypothetical protein ACJMK2_044650 [Sinanodonta woodiana]|uniref:Uncharacterized protein n=1 Tax=Sinanodonta woodiana TaxID=1069815 RepID=A0ABD3W3Y2_SINWO
MQCSLVIHIYIEMENTISTFDEPYTDPNDDAHDIEDKCSRRSDDSSYKPDESDPMDSILNSTDHSQCRAMEPADTRFHFRSTKRGYFVTKVKEDCNAVCTHI